MSTSTKPMFPANSIFRSANWFYIALVAVTFIAASRTIVASPVSFDSYTHFSAGKIIVEELRIPRHDDISHKVTQPSLTFLDHSWLADALLFLAAAANPTLGAIILLLPLLILSSYLCWEMLSVYELSKKMRLALVSLAVLVVLPYWRLHPIIFAVPLFLLIMIILERWQKSHKPKELIFLPVAFLLWAQIWGGFIIIPLVFTLVFLLFDIFRTIFVHDQNILQTALLAFFSFLFAVGSSLLNPLGARIYMYPLTAAWVIINQRQFSSLSGMLRLTNQNFVKDLPANTLQIVFAVYLITLILLLAVVLLRRFAQFKDKIVFSLPFFLPVLLPLLWIRFTPIAMFGSVPILGLVIGKRIGLFALTVLVMVLSVYVIFVPVRYFVPNLPVTQVALIKEWNLPSNILTSYDLTGYTLFQLYPQRVMLDAQDDIFDENALLSFTGPTNPVPQQAFEQIVSHNSIETLLVTADIGELALSAAGNPHWALLYFDTSGYLFVKKESVTPEFLAKYALTTVDLTRNLGFDPQKSEKAAAELEDFISRYPANILARGQLATIYRLGKQFGRAKEILESIPQSQWNFTIKTEMGRLAAAQGNCKSAEKWFLDALSQRQERNFARATLDLAVVYAGCFGDREKAKHYFNRFNSYILDPAERELQRQVAAEYGIAIDEQ